MFLNNDQWTHVAQDLHKKKSIEVKLFVLSDRVHKENIGCSGRQPKHWNFS